MSAGPGDILTVVRLALLLFPLVAAAETRPLNSFESEEDLAALRPRDARVSVVDTGVTDGARALRIDFQPVAWPAVFFFQNAPKDFRGQGELALDVTNPGETSVAFNIRVDDDPRADGVNFCRTGSGTIDPGETRTFRFPLQAAIAIDYGMRGLPAWPGSKDLGSRGTHTLRLEQIVAVQIFLASPATVRTLIVDNVRLRPSPPLDGLVDRYGQWTGGDWPGKVQSDEELTERRQTEDVALAAQPALEGRNVFGGWASGPRRGSTGFFRVEKIDGRWWLIDPEGALFFSAGLDSMRPVSPTFVQGREQMFTWLPENGDPLQRHFSYATGATQGPIREGRAYDFLAANLERKYGPDYPNAWAEVTERRMRSWGFNTIANWSDNRLWGRDVPYVATVTVGGTVNRVPVASGPGTSLPDPFDPRFAVNVANAIRPVAARAAGDRWCIGYFVDNELNWSSRTAPGLGALGQNAAGSPAKRALIAQLREKYTDIARLNEAWRTSYADWDSMTAPAPPNSTANEDLAAFTRLLAATYFRTVREELRKLDPDHLYLGSRFAGYTTEAVDACAEHCDVMSFNIYQNRINAPRWTFLNNYSKPAIIGEFHFGALDRGMFHPGLVAAASQADRAAMFVDYMRTVLDHPAFVGAHWFQYADQATTGRTLDGENYNIGFVMHQDTPYPEMVEAARTVLGEMYLRRYGIN